MFPDSASALFVASVANLASARALALDDDLAVQRDLAKAARNMDVKQQRTQKRKVFALRRAS